MDRVIGTGLHSDGSTYNIIECDFKPTDSKLTGQKWRECALCSWVDRESAMTQVSGGWYCNKNGCADEKATLLSQGDKKQ